MGTDERLAEAVRLEQLRRIKALEETNRNTREQVRQIIADQTSRGILSSGITRQRIASAHFDGARKNIDQAVRLRRQTLEIVPELGEDPVQWECLSDELETSVDRVARQLPEHIAQAVSFIQRASDSHSTFDGDVMRLKAYARREVAIVRSEYKLVAAKASNFRFTPIPRTSRNRHPTEERPSDSSADSNSPRVLISYSHDDRTHEERVLTFAHHLCRDGINAILDQYEPAPEEGWDLWMQRQFREADFVLLVCTTTYYRRVTGQEQPGHGLGATWEGRLINEELYQNQGRTTRFVPVLFAGSSELDIPEPLRMHVRYRADEDDGYQSLLRRITDQPRIRKPEIGARKVLPEEARPEPDAIPYMIERNGVREVDPSSLDATLDQSPPGTRRTPVIACLEVKGKEEENGLIVWLENIGLEPLEKCSLKVRNIREWAPAHKEFRRNPFEPRTLMRCRTLPAGGPPVEGFWLPSYLFHSSNVLAFQSSGGSSDHVFIFQFEKGTPRLVLQMATKDVISVRVQPADRTVMISVPPTTYPENGIWPPSPPPKTLVLRLE